MEKEARKAVLEGKCEFKDKDRWLEN